MSILKFTLVFGLVLSLSFLLLFIISPSLTPAGFGQTVNNTSVIPQAGSAANLKPVEGTYFDNTSGLRITFPSGWNGFEAIDKNNVKIISVSKNPPLSLSNSIGVNSPLYISVEISPNGMLLNSGQPLHYKNIINYNESDAAKSCNLLSSNNTTIDSLKGKVIVYSCPFPFNPLVREQVKAIAIEKNQTNLAIQYIATSVSNYIKYLPEFEKAIQSIQFSK
jgi:hypothetical protein